MHSIFVSFNELTISQGATADCPPAFSLVGRSAAGNRWEPQPVEPVVAPHMPSLHLEVRKSTQLIDRPAPYGERSKDEWTRSLRELRHLPGR